MYENISELEMKVKLLNEENEKMKNLNELLIKEKKYNFNGQAKS